MFVPASAKARSKLAYTWLPTNDKKSALVEFISADKATLAPIRAAANTPGIKVFDPKIHKKEEIEAEFQRVRKDFDSAKFGRGHSNGERHRANVGTGA